MSWKSQNGDFPVSMRKPLRVNRIAACLAGVKRVDANECRAPCALRISVRLTRHFAAHGVQQREAALAVVVNRPLRQATRLGR